MGRAGARGRARAAGRAGGLGGALDERAVRQGLARVEGYLLCHAETEAARADAEAFADRLEWLTAAQRAEVVRAYTHDRLTTVRADLERTARTARRLGHEYQTRYEALRARLLAVALVAYAVSVMVVVLVAAVAAE